MNDVMVNLGDRSYAITIQPSGLSNLGQWIEEKALGRHAAIISDDTVSKLYSQKAMDALRRSEIRSTLHVVPDGEGSKSFDTVVRLYTQLIEANLRRDGVVIGLGGGVVNDLAGFVAATYLRGVNLVQVPTSLLAQVFA